MKWQQVLDTMGAIETREGAEPDPLSLLAQRSMIDPSTGHQTSVARVSMTVGRSIEYGEVKCSATVSIDCPQSEAYIDLAGEVAFAKALELANDGMSQFGQPRIAEE